jgi:Taurine catabolism dioxygenase TauD, TfdA family
VVRVHPETGERALYVNSSFTTHLVGVTPHESRRLLDLFYDALALPEHTVRFAWQPGSVAFWDNRAAAHLAPRDADHLDGDRRLFRVTIVGDVPVGIDGRPSTSMEGAPFDAPVTIPSSLRSPDETKLFAPAAGFDGVQSLPQRVAWAGAATRRSKRVVPDKRAPRPAAPWAAPRRGRRAGDVRELQRGRTGRRGDRRRSTGAAAHMGAARQGRRVGRRPVPHHPKPQRPIAAVAGGELAEQAELQEIAEIAGVSVLHPLQDGHQRVIGGGRPAAGVTREPNSDSLVSVTTGGGAPTLGAGGRSRSRAR